LAYDLVRRLDPQSVLDVGCGYNEFCHWIKSNFGIRAVGVDFACPGADIICSAHQLPFPDNSFDLVTSFDTLEHLPPKAVLPVLREIARVGRYYIFSIHVRKSRHSVNGSNLHPTVQRRPWWKIKIGEAGGTVNPWKRKKYLYGAFV
jgi:ubiquinone/menaquinone biosynthesis C-methylase UbiE